MLTLSEIQSKLREGSATAVGILTAYLQRIEDHRELNIYLEVYHQEALSKAKALDDKIKNHPEQLGKLFGAFFNHKDVICYAGHKASAGSKMLEHFESIISATAIEKLLDEDAIIIGRVNCDEFGMGSSNENSFYGPTKNGADPSYIPGGSSGASAVSIQMNTCLISLGTDTGGSVRQPAAFCGVTGFKPGYGSISRYGLIAYASSFDQIGLIGQHAEDIRSFYNVMHGPDQYDSVNGGTLIDKKSVSDNPRFATLSNTFSRLKPELKESSENWMDRIRQNGSEIAEREFQFLDYLIPTYYILTTAEASSNLSRYDGVKYGYRSENTKDLESLYKNSRTEGFGEEVKRRIMLGTFVLSEGYFDAYYTKAQKIRRLILESIENIFKTADFILMPTTVDTAWRIGTKDLDPVDIYLSDIFTVLANLTGLPAISIPLGENKNGLPYGIQILAPKGQESTLLNFCEKLKKNT